MKRLLMFILMLTVIASISFAGDFSGETKVFVERDMVTDTNVYTIDAGAVYEAGFLEVGADVKANSEEDLDIGLPVAVTFGNLVLKAEPGADNIRIEEIYVFDGDIIFTAGMFKFEYGFGYGTDEVLDMSAKLTITDPIPGVVFSAEWIDADEVTNDVLGIVEVGVTVKY